MTRLLDDTTVDGDLAVTVTDAGTTLSYPTVLALRHRTTATPGLVFGLTQKFYADTTTTEDVEVGQITFAWGSPTHASRTGLLSIDVHDSTGGRTVISFGANGSAATVGFLGATAVTRRTGDTGTGLVDLGLFSGTPTFAAANLTGTLTEAQLPGGDWVTATSGETVGGSFTLTAASGTFEATGVTFTLPAAGTYKVTGQVRGEVTPSAAGAHYIVGKIRNTSDSADVANSETMVVLSSQNGVNVNLTAAMSLEITVTGAKTFELYASRNGTSFTNSAILSNSIGYTKFNWVRIA
jgi:hypothetical protein